MTEGVVVAIISTVGVILVAMIGVLTEMVRRVNHEMKPNSGSSLRDAVNRIEQRQESAERKLDRDNLRIEGIDKRLDGHITQSETILQILTKEKK